MKDKIKIKNLAFSDSIKHISGFVCYYHVTYKFHSESIQCQGTPCLKQAPYLKFKKFNTQPFSQTGQVWLNG